MRPILVEHLFPPVEPLLLRPSVRAPRLATFRFHRPVHTLVAAIILRASRAAELHLDPQPDPPYAQLAQATRTTRCERRSIVHPDDLGQPVLLENITKFPLGPLHRHVRHHLCFHQKTTVQIAHRQRIATHPVAQREPAFVIHTHHMVAAFRRGQRASFHFENPAPPPACLHHPMSLENLANRTHHRRTFHPVLDPQHMPDFFSSPGRMKSPLGNNQPLHNLIGPARYRLRGTALRCQASHPMGSMPIPPLVSGLARDPEGLAKLGHRKLAARKQADKLLFFFHW